MSFEILWENLTAEFVEAIREELDTQLKSKRKRPSFMGEVNLLALDFGKTPPKVELTDLTDPFPEFYQYEDVEHLNFGFDSNAGQHFPFNNVKDNAEEDVLATNFENIKEIGILSSGSLPNSPHAINRNEFASSFHALASNLRGLENPTCGWERELDVDSDQNSQELANGAYFDNPNVLGNPHVNMYSLPSSPPSLFNGGHHNLHSKHDEDIQAQLKIIYNGDLSLTISTSLNIDYPAKSFMSLPIVLKVTGFTLEANAVVALLQSKVGISLLPPADSSVHLLHALKVESIIGEASRHALRNVDRVESFILDKVRRLVEEKLVFPNFIRYPRQPDDSDVGGV